ncbi:hypothetical protein BDV3_007028 [Batrachochytrium dendrobatidis]|nr:hypothetical protein O5D80_007770 [Batrachochytrium dendrobatidis]
MGKVKEFIFLGTGTSGSVPNIHCLVKDPIPTCKVCLSAITYQQPHLVQDSASSIQLPLLHLPHFSKNRRRNTSGVVRFMHSDGRMRNVVIDCGKTFYDSALSWFVEYRLRNIDAVILTHGHADAIFGLDELRQWTIGGEDRRLQKIVDIYLDQETMEVVARAFPYMVDSAKATGGGDVPSVRFNIIEKNADGPIPFLIDNELTVIPFEVEHGKNGTKPFMSLGFRFEDLTYISDANAIPPRAGSIIKGSTHLIIDALNVEPHCSHFGFDQAIHECILALAKGGKGYFTGLSHSMDYDDLQEYIASKQSPKDAGIHIECGFDGQRIPIHD